MQFRGSKTPHSPNTWCFLGGWSEYADGGMPGRTWCREMHEELGVVIDPKDLVSLHDYVPSSSPFHRYIFYCEWPSIVEEFSLAENEEDLATVRWFTIEEALALPSLLTDGTKRDLLLFQERLRAA